MIAFIAALVLGLFFGYAFAIPMLLLVTVAAILFFFFLYERMGLGGVFVLMCQEPAKLFLVALWLTAVIVRGAPFVELAMAQGDFESVKNLVFR